MLGVCLMFVYDIIRVLRLLIPHSFVVISIEDVLYWIAAGIAMFIMLYKEDSGNIRWFAVAITFLGMLIYDFIRKTTGKMVTKLLKKLDKKDRISKRAKGFALKRKR